MTTARKSALLATLLLATSLFTATAHAAEPLDINTADASALATAIQGVGMKRAEAIIAYRDANGPFKTVDELQKVKGVGPKIVDESRDALTVGAR